MGCKRRLQRGPREGRERGATPGHVGRLARGVLVAEQGQRALSSFMRELKRQEVSECQQRRPKEKLKAREATKAPISKPHLVLH